MMVETKTPLGGALLLESEPDSGGSDDECYHHHPDDRQQVAIGEGLCICCGFTSYYT